STFGEWLKRDFMGIRKYGFFAGYFEAHGNLRELKIIDALMAIWAIVVPIGAIYGAFYFGYEGVGITLLGLCGAAIGLRWIIWLGHVVAGKMPARAKPFVLWTEMYTVWKLLQGPVVNPTLVRETMAKTRDQGAVWDQLSWSIIDRVIQYDPAV